MLPTTYLFPTGYADLLFLLPVLGFFNNGIFSGFPIYLPELYPTRLRATGAGFCFNAGRALASASPFLTGWLVTTLGTFGRAASTAAIAPKGAYLVPCSTARSSCSSVICRPAADLASCSRTVPAMSRWRRLTT